MTLRPPPETDTRQNPALNQALQTAEALASQFASTAAERDLAGGTPKAERDALRTSGLLALSVPTEFGGLGADWRTTLGVVRCLAQADSSLAHVFGFHHLMLATVRLFAEPAQWQPWLSQTVQQRWFWGNALNPLDKRTTVQHHAGWHSFSGRKSFCSGSADSDMLIASALDEATGKLLIAAVPTGRAGITLHGDWNNMGQRQTDSGSVSFEQVRVEEHELLLKPGPLSTPQACLRPLLAQLIFSHMFLGVAEGAFEEARRFTRTESRPWFKSGVSEAGQDPYVLAHYGEFWVGLESSRLLVERAAALFDAAWQQGDQLTAEQRGQVAVAVSTAKVASSRHGLELSSRLFEVTGARATQATLRLDRFWRNLRTQSLHDPIDYKLNELGQWALNEQLPPPSFYS